MPFKIQIVEDDKVTASFLQKKLTDVGFEVAIAVEGKSALEQIKQTKPNLVILDYFLPPDNAVGVLRQLRQDGNNVPVLILTSGVDSLTRQELETFGIGGYWEKPFNINTLIEAIEKIVQSTAVASSQKTILVIDDDQDILKIIKLGLKGQGFNAVASSDPRAALEAVHIHNPDLIVLDLTMPELNGWRFSQILRQEEKYAKYKGIPIIILSALIAEEGKPATPVQGDYMMAKPFDIVTLAAKIKELLNV